MRRRRRILAGLVVLLAVGLVAASASATVRPLRPADAKQLARKPIREEMLAQTVAARLTRRSPAVRCSPLGIQVPPGAFVGGITLMPKYEKPTYFLITPELCNYLSWFRKDPKRYDPAECVGDKCLQEAAAASFALQTVAHESYHVVGYRNEAQTECYGMQSLWFVAKTLGATAVEARHIAQFYWKTIYADRQKTTPEYWSAECRNGGKYDLRPESDAWPS
jgi:hypothetical protein